MKFRPMLCLVPLALALAIAAPATAAPGTASAPEADDLLAGARLLDGRAASLEARASARLEHADREAAHAQDLKRDASHAADRAPSLQARAEELEVVRVRLRAEADRDREQAKGLRKRASGLRTRAKAVVSVPRSTKRGRVDIAARGVCAVEIDGVPRGTAPMIAVSLAEGVHVITCASENARTFTRTISLRAEGTSHVSFEEASTTPQNPF